MTQYLQRGQRARLDAIGAGSDFIVELSLGAGGPLVDCACFGLDGQRKLSDERYMTFFNQPQTPCGGVAFSAPGRFTFNLAALPASIEVLTITLAIDGQGQVTQLPPSHLDILANDQAMARFDFSGALFAGERAVMLFEFYRKEAPGASVRSGRGSMAVSMRCYAFRRRSRGSIANRSPRRRRRRFPWKSGSRKRRRSWCPLSSRPR